MSKAYRYSLLIAVSTIAWRYSLENGGASKDDVMVQAGTSPWGVGCNNLRMQFLVQL